MDLKQLQYFVVSVESGSFKKAAEMLYTTQPHISKSIKNLETELNVQLLERKARGVEVTESGKKIYEYACNMLVDASRIHAAVEEDEKVLRVISAAGDRFATLFGAYCEGRAEKNLKVWYRDSTVEEIFPSLHHRTFDIGFFYARSETDDRLSSDDQTKTFGIHSSWPSSEPILYVGPQNRFTVQKVWQNGS